MSVRGQLQRLQVMWPPPQMIHHPFVLDFPTDFAFHAALLPPIKLFPPSCAPVAVRPAPKKVGWLDLRPGFWPAWVCWPNIGGAAGSCGSTGAAGVGGLLKLNDQLLFELVNGVVFVRNQGLVEMFAPSVEMWVEGMGEGGC